MSLVNLTNRNEILRATEEINSKIRIAEGYLEGILFGLEDENVPLSEKIELERCRVKTESGIARLKFQKRTYICS